MIARNLLFDVTRLVWRVWAGRLPTGIDRVCLAYLNHYGPRALAVVQRGETRLVLSERRSDELFALLRQGGPGFRTRLAALLAGAGLSRGPRHSTRDWLYLNIGHTGLDSPGLGAWLAAKHWRPVYLVHDLIPISHPEFCRPGESRKHRQRMRLVLDSAKGVIANSAATRDALANFARQAERTTPPCEVAWLGVEEQVPVNRVPPPKRPYFVTIGTIEGRKNHLMLLHLWERLVSQMGSAAPQLVLIGQRGWEADEVFALLDRSRRLRGHVSELGRCDDVTMHAWLDGARALLMPSFIEGFGIPVIEALQRGVPVIASDLDVFREIAGDIPHYLDPLDGPGWEAAVNSYSGECPDRARQLAAMPGFEAPSWKGHFAKVDAWLEAL
jgi:glycosyltransferase involved in cell wall biosynthesis